MGSRRKKRIGQSSEINTISILLLLTVVITLLVIGGTGTTVEILISMIIGAIALPTAIWVIMSLYHKMGGKSA